MILYTDPQDYKDFLSAYVNFETIPYPNNSNYHSGGVVFTDAQLEQFMRFSQSHIEIEMSTTYKIPFETKSSFVIPDSTDPLDFDERTREFIKSVVFDYTCYRIMFFYTSSSQAGMGYGADNQIAMLKDSYERKIKLVNGRLMSGNTEMPYLEDLKLSGNYIQRQDNLISKSVKNTNKYVTIASLTTKL